MQSDVPIDSKPESGTFTNTEGECCKVLYIPERHCWIAYSVDHPFKITSPQQTMSAAKHAAQLAKWIMPEELGDLFR